MALYIGPGKELIKENAMVTLGIAHARDVSGDFIFLQSDLQELSIF